MPTQSTAPICLGDTVLVADVGNSRIKLAVVADHGINVHGRRGLPTVGKRQDLDSHSFRPANLETWLNAAAPGSAVMLVASVHDAAAARLEAAIAELSAIRHRPLGSDGFCMAICRLRSPFPSRTRWASTDCLLPRPLALFAGPDGR